MDRICITTKGIALLAAIEAGICPKVDEGYNTDAFELFWSKFETELAKKRENGSHNAQNMLNNQAEDERYHRYKHRCQRNLIFKLLLSFFLGLLLMALLKLG